MSVNIISLVPAETHVQDGNTESQSVGGCELRNSRKGDVGAVAVLGPRKFFAVVRRNGAVSTSLLMLGSRAWCRESQGDISTRPSGFVNAGCAGLWFAGCCCRCWISTSSESAKCPPAESPAITTFEGEISISWRRYP